MKSRIIHRPRGKYKTNICSLLQHSFCVCSTSTQEAPTEMGASREETDTRFPHDVYMKKGLPYTRYKTRSMSWIYTSHHAGCYSLSSTHMWGPPILFFRLWRCACKEIVRMVTCDVVVYSIDLAVYISWLCVLLLLLLGDDMRSGIRERERAIVHY